MKWLLAVAALCLIGWGGFLSFETKNAGASLTYVAGVLVLVFAFLSRFKRFKGLGIEAELWEEKQEEADRLIRGMHLVSDALTLPLIEIVAAEDLHGIGGQQTKEERWRSQNKVLRFLREHGISDGVIRKAVARWDRANLFHLRVDVCRRIKPVSEELSQSISEEIKDARASGLGESDESFMKLIARREAAQRITDSLFHEFMIAEKTPNSELRSAWEKYLGRPFAFNDDDKAFLMHGIDDDLKEFEFYLSHGKYADQDRWPPDAGR